MTERRTILVTGGAGFIGSHLVERLLERGDAVTVVDDLSTGREANLSRARDMAQDRLQVVRAKVSEAEASLQGTRFHEIFHLAAAVGVRRVLEEPVESLETNLLETAAAIRLAERSDAAFLLASSSEVYGKAPRVPFREDDDMVFGPTSVTRWSYGCSKAIDEHMVLARASRGGLRAVVARIFNTVGPRQIGHWGMVLPRFIDAALEGRPLQVHGDGLQSRCFVDVRDMARGLEQLLGCPQAHGRVFNIGSDVPLSIRSLAEQVLSITGSRGGLVLVPYESVYPIGFEDLRARQPDLARIRGTIGFEATVPMVRTIEDLVTSARATRAEGRAA
ncbi:MAG: NAD-dependent epimerase/dehydratase family protein [Planctomycetes bacterium]|nr:NAD-dependent epimerase/dehydratase family protein [Planctomycetota bacterium]